MWHTAVFAITACGFFCMTCSTVFHLWWMHRLPPIEDFPERTQASACSVVIAARDEESRIEQAIGRLFAQRDVELEVIVVDDRSVDRTNEILQQVSRLNDRLHFLRVDELPEGWLGKCHACHLGAAKAKADWILFTDADCWLKPDVISRAIRVADKHQADHVTLTPGTNAETAPARAWHLAFLMSLCGWASGVNRDRPKAYLGMGAFNLVRAAAYRESGGYEALRLTVLDDVRLGLLLRRAGKRTRAFIGGDDVECQWGVNLRSMIKIMEKNYFAALDYRLMAALGAGLGGMLFWCAAVIGPLTGTMAGYAAGLALLSGSIPAAVLARRLGWSVTTGLLTPFIFPALFYAILNSTWVTVRQGGVRWRGTFYPLKTLKLGSVR